MRIPNRVPVTLLLAAAVLTAASVAAARPLDAPQPAASTSTLPTLSGRQLIALADDGRTLAPSPTPAPTPAPAARKAPAPTPAPRRPQVSGLASHYPGTAGFIGRAVVALPGALGGRYTGGINGTVTICADRCVVLPVVDYCACYWGTSEQRVADLSPQAWALVTDTPLNRGLVRVTVILD